MTTAAVRAIKKHETKWYWTGIIGFIIGKFERTSLDQELKRINLQFTRKTLKIEKLKFCRKLV